MNELKTEGKVGNFHRFSKMQWISMLITLNNCG